MSKSFGVHRFCLAEHPGYVFAAGMALENMGGRGTGHYDFYAIPLNGSRHLNLSVWPRSGSGRLPTDIEVSPDGNWLLYTGQDTAAPAQ